MTCGPRSPPSAPVTASLGASSSGTRCGTMWSSRPSRPGRSPMGGTPPRARCPGARERTPLAGLCRLHYSRKRRGRGLTDDQPAPGSPSGHGRYGLLDDDGDAALCLECGLRRAALGYHVQVAHQLTAREYKLRHGLPLGAGLTSAGVREAMSVSARERVGTPGWRL
ncbi:MucR family transcriptional regulator [Arsenicicoccus cauae]|uniref:MucR family transcriptional regulator n=2 Tax=Arsenicicoccus TaxID=267408 RepID=UPI0009FCDFC2